MLKRTCLILSMFMMLSVLPGCAWFKSACEKAMPVISKGQVYVDDAGIALDQAAAAIALMQLTDEQKKAANYAIDKCRVALRAADQLMGTAADACSSPDIASAFDTFIKAWNALEPLLVRPGSVGATPGQQAVYAPLVVLEARLKAAQR